MGWFYRHTSHYNNFNYKFCKNRYWVKEMKEKKKKNNPTLEMQRRIFPKSLSTSLIVHFTPDILGKYQAHSLELHASL